MPSPRFKLDTFYVIPMSKHEVPLIDWRFKTTDADGNIDSFSINTTPEKSPFHKLFSQYMFKPFIKHLEPYFNYIPDMYCIGRAYGNFKYPNHIFYNWDSKPPKPTAITFKDNFKIKGDVNGFFNVPSGPGVFIVDTKEELDLFLRAINSFSPMTYKEHLNMSKETIEKIIEYAREFLPEVRYPETIPYGVKDDIIDWRNTSKQFLCDFRKSPYPIIRTENIISDLRMRARFTLNFLPFGYNSYIATGSRYMNSKYPNLVTIDENTDFDFVTYLDAYHDCQDRLSGLQQSWNNSDHAYSGANKTVFSKILAVSDTKVDIIVFKRKTDYDAYVKMFENLNPYEYLENVRRSHGKATTKSAQDYIQNKIDEYNLKIEVVTNL